MLTYKPIYRKMHYFLKVGTRHVVSTEVQILNCKDDNNWFGDEQLSIVIGKLQGELMARIDRKESDADLQIIEEDSLLIVYKFRRTNDRDSIILRKDQMVSLGLVTDATPMYGDGEYTSLQLFPDKLTITVSPFDQSEELLNLTRLNLSEELGSKYFDDLKKQITNSEKKKKNTLKKIWSKSNQIFKEDSDSNRMSVNSDSNKIHIESDSDQTNTENDTDQTNTENDTDQTNTENETNQKNTENDSSDLQDITTARKYFNTNINEPADKVMSFKDKISAYEHDKKYKNIERDKKPTTNVTKKQTILHADSPSSSKITSPNSNNEPTNEDTSNILENNQPIDRCLKGNSEKVTGEFQIDTVSSVTNTSPVTSQDITESSPIIPLDGQINKQINPQDGKINKQTNKQKNKQIKKSGNHNKSDKENEEFSDSDDFSSVKIKRKRKRPLFNPRKSKRRKGNAPIPSNDKTEDKRKGDTLIPSNDKTGDKHSKILPKPGTSDNLITNLNETKGHKSIDITNDNSADNSISVNTNRNSNAKKISMEELIKTKENKDKSSMQLEEIPTLVADKTIDLETIDLEEYGNVSLENIKSVDELSVEQIRDLVREMEEELRDIFQGKTKCERHDLFKQGGKQRGCLNMRVAFGLFSEEQEQSVSTTLMELFCKKSKYFDYTMKVLLPETMAMLYGKVAKITRKEADKLIMERC